MTSLLSFILYAFKRPRIARRIVGVDLGVPPVRANETSVVACALSLSSQFYTMKI